MTEATVPANPSEPVEFLQIWSNSFSQVLGQITGSAVACVVRTEAPPDLTAPGEGDFWAGVTCSGPLRGEMILRLAGPQLRRPAHIFLADTPTPGAQATDCYCDA